MSLCQTDLLESLWEGVVLGVVVVVGTVVTKVLGCFLMGTLASIFCRSTQNRGYTKGIATQEDAGLEMQKS